MLAAKNLEKFIELENNLKSQYESQLQEKDVTIEKHLKKQEEQKTVIAKQLTQITQLSAASGDTKRIEQLNRELSSRATKLQDEIDSQKKRIKALQKELAEDRNQLKELKQFDPKKMKKHLDANKKKLAEKTTGNELLQKSVNKYKSENAELERKVKELEAKVESLEPAETEAEVEETAEA